jgi:gluconate 5-dehydrogenase
MTTELAGIRALVTGGTSGLGLAMVHALVAAGATVAFTGRSAERVDAVAGSAIGLVGDVRDEAAVETVVEAAWSQLGGVDLLVNNAGLGMRSVNPRFLTDPQGFWEVPVEGFRAVVETNLTGYFLMARAVVPRMLAAGAGHIVNVSMNHSTMNRRGFVPYGPARAGAEALSRIMAADLALTPIRVNLLLPGGATRTGMVPDRDRPGLLEPHVMGPPIVWLATADVRDQRIVATEFVAPPA